MPVKTQKAPSTTTKTPATKTPAQPKVSDKQKYSLTQGARNAIRDVVFLSEDNTEFHPLDYSLIRPLVIDADIAKFDAAVKSKTPAMIEIDLNKGFDPKQPISENSGFQFVRAWLRANGKNRNPNLAHYGNLANGFATNFVTDATHWVVDVTGMVANGGHSGRGVALAFYPPCVEYGVEGIVCNREDGTEINADDDDCADWLAWGSPGQYFLAKSEKTGLQSVHESSPLAWVNADEGLVRPGQYEKDDNGNETYIQGSDSQDSRLKHNLVIRLAINADPKSCLKMDDVRLEASFDHYLQMVGPIRAFIKKLPSVVAEKCGELFRNYYLRVNHKGETFGSLGKGGRLTKNEVQNWFIAGIPALLDSIELLKVGDGTALNPMVHFKKPQGGTGGVSIPMALVAMMVSEPEGRERIAELLCRNYTDLSKAPQYFQDLVYFICLPKGSQSKINADMIVETLVLWGIGKTDPVKVMREQYPDKENAKGEMQYKSAWQVELNRAMGWDRTNLDSPVEEQFTDVCIAAATKIAEILGNEAAVKDAKMKATRKGLGKRGPNSKK